MQGQQNVKIQVNYIYEDRQYKINTPALVLRKMKQEFPFALKTLK